MKKIILILLALVSCISIDAQVLKIYKNGVLVGKYTAAQADNFVFENEEETSYDLTCAEAAAICLEMEDRATSEEDYTVTGYITEVIGSVSRNQQSFWMADTQDGGKVFEAYWANLPEGVSEFTVGTKVKITGKLMRFGSTPEIKNADVVILEQDGDEDDQPTSGIIEKNCADAAAICLAMEDKATSEETYAVTGYITEVIGNVSRNQQSFWMADTQDGGRVFEAYWANLPEGVTEFTVGSKVKITGKLLRYGTTPEIKNADVEILEVGEGGGDQPGGDDQNVGDTDATLVMSALYDITEGSVEAGTVSANGITLTFDQNGGNNEPKYYWNATEAFRSVRMYAMNKMTVSASKKIDSIKITCAAGSGSTNYNGNPTMTTSAGTLTQNSDNITVVVSGINANSCDIVNEHISTSGGVQLRVVSIEVVYAK